MFNTRDYLLGWPGWTLNLGQTNGEIPCKPYAGIIPRAGQKIKCYVYPSNQNSIYYPTIVSIRNFESILINTPMEIHIMNCANLGCYNQGQIYVKAQQTAGDGSIT